MAMKPLLTEADHQSRAGMLGEHITSLTKRFRRELAPMAKILPVIMARFKFFPRAELPCQIPCAPNMRRHQRHHALPSRQQLILPLRARRYLMAQCSAQHCYSEGFFVEATKESRKLLNVQINQGQHVERFWDEFFESILDKGSKY